MSKNNCIYKVVVYNGGMDSHDCKVVYTTSKQSKAEEYLHDYCKQHDEVCKAYIERSYGREALRNQKRRYDDDE